MKIDWIMVLRDVLIVAVLGTLGTLGVTLLLGSTTGRTQFAVALGMLTIGFALSGSLKGRGRFKHLAVVGLGVWLVVLLDAVVRASERLPGILVVGTLSVALAMAIGGALSLVIRREAPTESPPQD